MTYRVKPLVRDLMLALKGDRVARAVLRGDVRIAVLKGGRGKPNLDSNELGLMPWFRESDKVALVYQMGGPTMGIAFLADCAWCKTVAPGTLRWKAKEITSLLRRLGGKRILSEIVKGQKHVVFSSSKPLPVWIDRGLSIAHLASRVPSGWSGLERLMEGRVVLEPHLLKRKEAVCPGGMLGHTRGG
jgi:hypothetical protein